MSLIIPVTGTIHLINVAHICYKKRKREVYLPCL